jgi:hypothetical protein
MEPTQQSTNLLRLVRQKDKQLQLKWNRDQSIERQRQTRQKKPTFYDTTSKVSNDLEILRSTSRLSTNGAYTEKKVQIEIKPQQRYFIPNLVDLCGEAIALGFEQLCKSCTIIYRVIYKFCRL